MHAVLKSIWCRAGVSSGCGATTEKGCDDAGDFGSKVYPYHGCQLMQLPKDVEPQHWDRGPMFSSFQMGYITGDACTERMLALFAPGVEAACLDGLCGFSLTQAMLRGGLEAFPPIALSLKALVQSQPEMQSGGERQCCSKAQLAQLP